jgi:hypothetical protein
MTRTLTRTHLHSSGLLRTLSDLALLETAASDNGFAQKLAAWIDFSSAIKLCAVHTTGPTPPGPAVPASAVEAVVQAFARTRAALEKTVAQAAAGKSRNPFPRPDASDSLEDASAYAPYRKFHLAQQRELDESIRTLRSQVRDMVGRAAPRLRPLLALDATLETALSEREGYLLAKIPNLLEKRFRQLHDAHRQTAAGASPTDHPGLWTRPGGWLARYGQELHTVLLAELDLRLQPSVGLIEALQHEPT